MPSSTPVFALPYPLGGEDVRDGNDAIQALAARLEALLNVPSGRRNVIRNGDFSIAQRGNGPFTTATAVDGCQQNYFSGSTSSTRVAQALGAAGGINGAAWALQTVISGQSTSNDYSGLVFKIEDVRTLAGRQSVLSFIAFAASGTPKIGVQVYQFFGSGGSASIPVTTAISAVTIDTNVTRYTVTFTVPSIAGKLIGTSNNDYLQVFLLYSAGVAVPAASGIGLQNNTFTITDVQLEAGDKATPFERISQQAQDAWNKRYFKRFQGNATGSPGGGFAFFANGGSMSATSVRLGVSLPNFRAMPIITLSSGTAIQVNVGGPGAITTPFISSVTTLFWSPNTVESFFIDCAVTPSVNIGYPAFAYIVNNAANYIDFSSEL